jgi:hypothetical protein
VTFKPKKPLIQAWESPIPIYKKGERVRHPTKPSWGIGQVLEDSTTDSVRVFFVGAGEKLLALAFVQPITVSGTAAASTLLDNLRIRTDAEAIKFKSLPDSIQYFLTEFPGGFRGERLEREERRYKVQAHQLADAQLGARALQALIEAHNDAEVCARALRVINATNLIFPNEKMQLKDGLKSAQNQKKFAAALVALLHDANDKYEMRFSQFANVLEEIDAAKWTTATYFPYFVFPKEHMFLKPTVTQEAAELCGFEISYRAELNWTTYERVLAFSKWLFGELATEGLEPRDMIDVQSFIWCIGPGNTK